jgi:hypothetical protein
MSTTLTGRVRANHFHKTDWHYSYVQGGEVWYDWRPQGSKDRPKHPVFPAATPRASA